MLLTIDIDEATGRVTVDPSAALKRAPEAEPWDGESISAQMIKSSAERRYGLYVAYPSGRLDVSVAADGHRDFASAAAVEDAAWSYLRKSPRVGLFHADQTDGAGTVAESYIYRGPDWHISAADGSEQVIKAGDWLVGIIWEPRAWEMVKTGRINGVSMQGTASRRKPSREALATLRQ